ncbi:hypothetical protein [Streptomyces melanogenes]|uniref:hypothetical protein n=1 Tax=Streptomyces melanogenes TaxID=67326 RepID=UPI0037BC3561
MLLRLAARLGAHPEFALEARLLRTSTVHGLWRAQASVLAEDVDALIELAKELERAGGLGVTCARPVLAAAERPAWKHPGNGARNHQLEKGLQRKQSGVRAPARRTVLRGALAAQDGSGDRRRNRHARPSVRGKYLRR